MNTSTRVYYSGPEPQMVPATLADFECSHGVIGTCKKCNRTKAKTPACKLCGQPCAGLYCWAHIWATE